MNESWNDTQKLLAFVIVVAFIVIILIWMFIPPKVDAASTSVLNTLVGTLGGFAGMVVTFFFGSSSGSAAKDQTIKQLLPTPTNGTAPAPDAGTTHSP